MSKINKVIVKIMVLILCINTLTCINTLAVEKPTANVKTNITFKKNDTEITSGSDITIKDSVSTKTNTIAKENTTKIPTRSAVIVKDSISSEKDFEFNEATGTILKYIGNDSDVVIPSEINGIKVTAIGKRAFRQVYSLNTLTVPEGITSIGEGAFYYCKSLKEVTLPDSVNDIQEGAFSMCIKLKSINLPKKLTIINSRVFAMCFSLENIELPDSLTNIKCNAFSCCSKLLKVKIPNNRVTIFPNAFKGCTARFYVNSFNQKQSLLEAGIKASQIIFNVCYYGKKFDKKWMTAIFCGDLNPCYPEGKEKKFQNITGFHRNNMKLDEIYNQLKSAKLHYADSVTIPIHIDLNPITKKIIIGEDLNKIQKVFDEAKKQGIVVEMIKIHYQSPWDGSRIAYLSKNNDSFLEFYNEYMRVIKIIAEKFKGQTKKFGLFNEFGLAYRTKCWENNHIAYKDYSNRIVEMIKETRSLGYEVGISTCDVYDAKNIPEVVINALDFLGVNWYPSSNCLTYDKYVKDIKEKYKNDLKWFEDFKTEHSKTQLYITETGVEDYKGSVKKSNVHYVPQIGEHNSDGKYQCMNLRMLYEVFKDSKIDGICYWWFLWGWTKSTKEVCKECFH